MSKEQKISFTLMYTQDPTRSFPLHKQNQSKLSIIFNQSLQYKLT